MKIEIELSKKVTITLLDFVILLENVLKKLLDTNER